MGKKMDKVIYEIANPVCNDKIDMLEDLKEMVDFKNDIYESKKTDKKKIAIVYDVDGWAFSNIAREIKTHLSSDFDIDTFPVEVFKDNIVKLTFLVQEYDLVHCLWRGQLSSIENEYARGYIHNLGMDYEEFMEKYFRKVNFTTSVYDHNFLDEETFSITKAFVKYATNYTVSSSILKNIYDQLELDKKPLMMISDGVDLNKFKPKNLDRFKAENLKNRKITIGWVGNSEFTDSGEDSDLKGVRKIINPVIEELIQEGYPIEKKFADRKDGLIPHHKMPDYYNSIDLYVCASKLEGTPNPVLESMASGIPVISTNVGIVGDAFGEKQKEYILQKRSKECLKEKLIDLLNNLDKFEELSNENLSKIKDWSWEKKCDQFKEFFHKTLL